MSLAAYKFMAQLGKVMLRPGGKEGSDFLLHHTPISTHSKVLEVACNRGQSMIDIACRFNCKVTGVDQSKELVTKANENIKLLSLQDQCKAIVADACDLPFEKEYFDIVINEAMLAMLSPKDRVTALQEYKRVLKPGAYLLTHDVIVTEKNEHLQLELSKTVNKVVSPESYLGLLNSLLDAGFEIRYSKTDRVNFLSSQNLVKDEGALHAAQILRKAQEAENINQYNDIRNFFDSYGDQLRYVCFICQK